MDLNLGPKPGIRRNPLILVSFHIRSEQQQQKQIKTSSNADSNPSLSFDFINKYPLLKKLIIWYQRVSNENEADENKDKFLNHFIDTITDNLTKSKNNFRYCNSIKNFTLSLKNNKSRYFITQPAYLSVEINAHNSLYLILLVKQKQLQPQALNIPIFNSPACESIFRNTRALSGIYSTIVNFTVHDFLRHAQRLPLSNDIECKQLHNGSVGKLVLQVHYKHRVERQSSFTHSQLEIDEIDIEQVITDAYHHAVDMLEGLDILNLLEEKHVLELKPLREYLFRQLNSNSQKHNYSFQISNIDDEVFESDDDNDEDGNDTTNDLSMNEGNDDSSINNDYTDEDEQNNTQDLINTTKKDFSGVKVADKVEPHIEHTYFKVKLNHDTKCLHKQTACWLLTEEKSKLSNDRLLRVQQVNK
ncbi:unnamed protein product [Rotaria magnacalcarata]|uniref:Uncharacterized protein n=1 Tax=Rotaria magnacalcarata TaxID=392030 RepID=A0A816HF24_9BILA|nr:unnamed protein product [Rotaria magnacalcarata]